MYQPQQQIDIAEYKFGFNYPDESVFKTRKGLSEEVVRAISRHKQEPEWMLNFRLRSLKAFQRMHMPNWGADLSTLDFDDMYYYAKPLEDQKRSWDDVPDSIKETFERIGIPEAEQKFLGGVGAQYDSCLHAQPDGQTLRLRAGSALRMPHPSGGGARTATHQGHLGRPVDPGKLSQTGTAAQQRGPFGRCGTGAG